MAIEPHSSNKALQDLIEKLNGQTGGGGTSNHEQLEGLLGGNSSGHFHLTDVQLKLLENAISVGNNHEALSGLLGGNAAGHHHLTKDELNKLSDYPNFSSLNHESLQGLLGGNNNGHYHLTIDLLNKLVNMPASGVSGSDGQAATIQIGTVTTGAAGLMLPLLIREHLLTPYSISLFLEATRETKVIRVIAVREVVSILLIISLALRMTRL